MEPQHEAQDVGDLADEYTLLGELGRGGNAIVYKARDRALFRDVAIKVVRPRFAATADEAIARLEREARTVARLQHPNIVTVYAVKRLNDGGLALVMQLVPGRTLKQAIQDDGPFEPERAERVIKDIAEALAFAHANGVVHRDVKPENVFMDSVSGRALLSDFGIAHNNEFDSRLTMTGSAIGTPAYMAPEQIDGAPANARSDLYSLGLVAWEMLSGERPWAGDALYNVIYKQKHEELPAIDSLRPGAVPARLQYIVERMLQKRPGARWAGADGLLAALNAWVVPSDWKQWEESHKRRRDREKAAPKMPVRRGDASEDATVRFARPTSGVSPAVVPEADVALLKVPTAPSVPVVDDDAAPSWATDADASSTGRRSRWVAVVALLGITLAGAAYAMYMRQMGPFATVSGNALAMTDAATVELPIVSDTAQSAPSVPVPTSMPTDSGVAAAAAADSQVVAQRRIDSLRVDSLVAVARRAERRAARAAIGVAPPAEARVAVAAPTVRATDDPGIIAAGGRHSCALVSSRVLCWGANDRGQLGDGDAEARSTPAPIVGDLEFVQVTTGLSHSCGVARGGDAYCWGADDRGQLGDATFTSRSAPVRVAGNQTFRLLRAGQYHTCGLTTAGDVLCWGANANGQLGDGGTSNRSSPVSVGGGLRFVSLSAGWNHSCAIAYDGKAYCWGANASGQLGNGTRTDTRTPTAVSAEQRFTSMAAGATHTCATADGGETFCWGRNSYGQLGTGGTGDQAVPAPVFGGTRFASVTVGGVHSCGRTRSGQVFCWGRNVYGQLGDGTNATRDVPTRVAGSTTFSAVHASGAHTCATGGEDTLWCWGFNVEGQLGDGTRNHLSRPTRVVMPAR
ncbi:protein kinase domain-containing protein [Gemmatimonas phototrophica]|uniref:RCC1 domain-containing protein n=1 Tax=Gemmatimonas phototrophica TaxID=1379270 RepID=UPI0006A6BFDF|nr:protein kinase [Gemmatimonas phototrophica]